MLPVASVRCLFSNIFEGLVTDELICRLSVLTTANCCLRMSHGAGDCEYDDPFGVV